MPWSNDNFRDKKPNPWENNKNSNPMDFNGWFKNKKSNFKPNMPYEFRFREILILVLILVAIWLSTGFYIVGPQQVGIETIFGRYNGLKDQGLHYNLPYPIGTVYKPDVGHINTIYIGYQVSPQAVLMQATSESLMLTADENIVDLSFEVQWRVDPLRAVNYIFNLANPEGTIKAIAESAVREVVGRKNIQPILTNEQSLVASEVKDIVQQALDAYGAGVKIEVVQLVRVNPPNEVKEAFFDVNAAQQDAERLQNEAKMYASEVIPNARGQAAKIIQESEAYKTQIVALAKGDAQYFTLLYNSYKLNPQLISDRMYLEAMGDVLKDVDKTIIDDRTLQEKDRTSNVLKILPLGK